MKDTGDYKCVVKADGGELVKTCAVQVEGMC